MININAYAVFDKTAQTFASPFFMPNDDVAKRNFRYSLKRFDAMLVRDLELYYLGGFDNQTGTFFLGDKYVVDTGLNVLCELDIEEKNNEVKK